MTIYHVYLDDYTNTLKSISYYISVNITQSIEPTCETPIVRVQTQMENIYVKVGDPEIQVAFPTFMST